MAQPKHNPDAFTPRDKNADILPFKSRKGPEAVDPAELSNAECVSFFVQTWNDPALADKPIADVINADVAAADNADAWQERLHIIVDKSPLFDHYDEMLEADPATRLIDSTIRATLSDSETMMEERKAMRSLMYMRAAEVVERPDEDLESQLARLPLGDESLWVALIERLAKQE